MDALLQLLTNFGVTWPKFTAQVILFLIVYGILKKFAFQPIIEMLEERRRRIQETQNHVEKIKQQLADSERAYQETLHRAHVEAQALIQEARQSGEHLVQQQMQNALQRADELMVKAKHDIDNERRQVLSEVKKEMVNLVVDTTARVAGKILSRADQDRLLEESKSRFAQME